MSISKFNINDVVYIRSTNDVGLITNITTTTMGHFVYNLDVDSFDTGYPFYEEDLGLVVSELENNEYSAYLDNSLIDMKYDQGKIRHSLLVPEFIEELIAVLEFGANKYEENSWKDIDEKRYADALYRHFLAYSKGQTVDVESGCNHMAHIAANAMFILWKINQENK